jgi:glycosyltransferase involved in cell wall biosynthesis
MYIGYRNKRIITVSELEFDAPTMHTLKVPEHLSDVTKDALLQDYEVCRGEIVKQGAPVDPKYLKVAFVGVYKIQCGIATYAEALFPAIGAKVGEWKIFAEWAGLLPDDRIVECWRRGEPLTELVRQIDLYNPDIVLILHEFGIFPVATHWLSLMSELQRYKTIVTFHSIYRHKDKTICEAASLNSIVHTNIAKKILKEEKKVTGDVVTIPHFCYPYTKSDKYWNIYKSKHTIVQFGFGFRYKGWEQAIEAVAKLKPEFPDIFFTGLFSESAFNRPQHDQYYYELCDLIHKYKVTENVALLRGYQSDEVLDSFLKTNQIALFPYPNIDNGHQVAGCSGAARLAMSKEIPVIVSDSLLFDDLTGVCERPSNVSEICNEIRKLFNDKEAAANQLIRQELFMKKNCLENIVDQYLEVFSLNN